MNKTNEIKKQGKRFLFLCVILVIAFGTGVTLFFEDYISLFIFIALSFGSIALTFYLVSQKRTETNHKLLKSLFWLSVSHIILMTFIFIASAVLISGFRLETSNDLFLIFAILFSGFFIITVVFGILLLLKTRKHRIIIQLTIGILLISLIILYSRFASIDAPHRSFKVTSKSRINYNDNSETYNLIQELSVEPTSDFTFGEIQEIENGTISKSEVVVNQKFVDRKSDGMDLYGANFVLNRTPLAQKQKVGFLQSKLTFSDFDLTLKIGEPHTKVEESKTKEDYAFKASHFEGKSEIEVEMPKNSVIAVQPKAEIDTLPDKDIVTIKSDNFIKKVDIYFIDKGYARLSLLKVFFKDSLLENIVKLLQFLFLPVIMFFVTAFQDKLKNFINNTFSRKEGKKRIGFLH